MATLNYQLLSSSGSRASNMNTLFCPRACFYRSSVSFSIWHCNTPWLLFELSDTNLFCAAARSFNFSRKTPAISSMCIFLCHCYSPFLSVTKFQSDIFAFTPFLWKYVIGKRLGRCGWLLCPKKEGRSSTPYLRHWYALTGMQKKRPRAGRNLWQLSC